MKKLLGKKVRVIKNLKRRGFFKEVKERHNHKYFHKEWREINDCKGQEGIIYGKVTKKNGYVDYSDESAYFVCKENIQCYLVALNMNHRIVVPLDGIEIIEE